MANGHPIIAIPFRIPNRADFPIEFVVDTGFTDELCLPSEAVALLNLPFRYDMRANLADNSQVMLPLHKAIIIWNGEERETRVFATGRRPLLGTALLDSHELVIQFTEGGLVTIDELWFSPLAQTQANLAVILNRFFNSMINSQSHWKNPLPSPHFPLPHTC